MATIAFDLVNGTSDDLNSFVVITSGGVDPTQWSPGDWFGVASYGSWPQSAGIPFALADDSVAGVSGSPFAGDNQGIIDSTTASTDRFFGSVDTVNGNNPDGRATATWEFNISSAENLSLSIDMAAMGDFESSDSYVWSYSIDGGAFQDIFVSSVDEAVSQTYTMESGTVVVLDDPMRMDGVVLNDEFQTFTEAISGTGSTLTLQVTGGGDGGSEAFAAKNIVIEGDLGATSPSLVISEIMFNPASAEDDWEWVELYNAGSSTVNLAGYVLDDINSIALTDANIASGSIAAGETAVLYNADDVSAADFEAAWGKGINLVAVTNWSALALNNGGDTIGLWESFTSYEGDNVTQANALISVAYDGSIDDGNGSVYLTDLTNQTSFALSADGVSTPAGGAAYTSAAAGGNSGEDVGSPGGTIVVTPPTIVATIAQIQGSGFESPLLGQTVATSGIVTKRLSNGFYIQTPDGMDDGNAATSEGLWVFTGSAPTVALGDAVDVTGGVSEFFGLTQLAADAIAVTSTGNALPAAVQITLGGLEQTDLEAYEGMRFELVSSSAEPLVIIENFNFDRFGEITIAEGNQTQPTQIFDPATQQTEIQALIDQNNNERLLLDDGVNSQNPDEFAYIPANVGDNGNGFLDAGDTFTAAGPTARLGAEASDIKGVLSFGFSEYRLLVDETITIDPDTNEGARSAEAPEVGGDLSVVSFNVLNYFTTIDVSGAGTGPDGTLDPRGADSVSELERQTAKLVAALAELDADVVGLQEIENNGIVAIGTLVDELNAFHPSCHHDEREQGGISG